LLNENLEVIFLKLNFFCVFSVRCFKSFEKMDWGMGLKRERTIKKSSKRKKKTIFSFKSNLNLVFSF